MLYSNQSMVNLCFQFLDAALEALNSTRCSFTVRVLDDNEELVSRIPPKGSRHNSLSLYLSKQ